MRSSPMRWPEVGRRNPRPPPALTNDELEQISALLLEAGSGALVWWRIRGSSVAGSAIGEQLREAYRLHALQVAVYERELSEVFGALQGAGVEALLVKGWTRTFPPVRPRTPRPT